jgi:NADH-quinone oxidoreductase subunit N
MALLMVGVFSRERSRPFASSPPLRRPDVRGGAAAGRSPRPMRHRRRRFNGSLRRRSASPRFMKLADAGRLDRRDVHVVAFLARTADKFEYPVLIVLATLGMMVMISANDLIALYIGLELQSLALYVIASINRDSCARPKRA